LSRVLPIALADRLFKLVRPLAFALHCRPLNRVRRAYRMPSLGYDLRRIYTDADHVLYADIRKCSRRTTCRSRTRILVR
jgi:UDP:flavonoid glycosyltransferase YjiC (YdhE family)